MNDNAGLFAQKAAALEAALLSGRSFTALEAELSPALCTQGLYTAFAEICDIHSRARVFRCTAGSLEAAWRGALAQAERAAANGYAPLWVKAGVVRRSEYAQLADVNERLENGKLRFFRRGICFDGEMQRAVTEAEANCYGVYTYKKKRLELTSVNRYLAACSLPTLSVLPERVVLFDCMSVFCDEKAAVHTLYTDGACCGRRVCERVSADDVKRVISTSSDFLAMMEGLDGKFEYGFFPLSGNAIAGYNTVRHASALWSLVCAARVTGDKFTLMQAKKAAEYMVSLLFCKYAPNPARENTAFLPDPTANEVKLGGSGIAIVALTELMELTGDYRYRQQAVELGNGILELFDERDGSFFHVLRYPTLAPRDKFRTVYYDGEAVFGLCRLYALTRERRWLDAAKQAVDRFIREDYTQYRDHWVAYAVNELSKHLPEDKYLSFGLKNAAASLKSLYSRETIAHTSLELLCVTFELYARIKEQGLECSYLTDFDEGLFIRTIYRRVWRMLDGYAYPELAMYFKEPAACVGAIVVRQGDFRIRIDDIGHFCAAYCSFYRNFEKLERLRAELGESAVQGLK